MTLQEHFLKVKNEPRALGHWNFSNVEGLLAMGEVAKEKRLPLFIGTSQGERNFIGLHLCVALRDAVAKQYGVEAFLNADHSKSIEVAKAAVDAGYDSIHFDGSELSFDDNIAQTTEVVQYARAKNPDINIEGELGYLPGSSEVLKDAVEIKPEFLTDPEQAKDFVSKTGVNRLAVSIGNLHGVTMAGNPHIDVDRLKQIDDALPEDVTLTMHGGSGIPDEDIKAALGHGLSNVHVNTEIRMAYTKGLRATLDADKDVTTPYKIMKQPVEEMKKVIVQKLELFGN